MVRSSVQQAEITDKAAAERLSLETAFQSFTEVSAQLADSYQHLQDHVSELTCLLVLCYFSIYRMNENKETIVSLTKLVLKKDMSSAQNISFNTKRLKYNNTLAVECYER